MILKELRQQHENNPVRMRSIELAEKILAEGEEVATQTRTFVGIPHIHDVHWGTARGVLIEASEKPHMIDVKAHPASLLAYGFNTLWCDALNAKKYKYWLLCHADISFRTGNWLDRLMEDLERRGLDAIHVPMAIKDERRLTSTGIGNGDDEWMRIRRLTTTELQKLPPVFELDEMVEVMKKGGHVPRNPVFCPNTGVLLVKLNPEWIWDFPGFTIKDQLETRVSEAGVCYRAPLVVPEDWNFGFYLQSKGLRIGGCKRIRTNHHHPCIAYTNDCGSVGQPQDLGYLADKLHQ